jgi:hypothetical protein
MSSWGLGWKRSSEIFHLTLDYGDFAEDDPDQDPSSPPPQSPTFSPTATTNGDLGFRIELDWSAADDEDQVALRLQSQLMVALPPPHDAVSVDLKPDNDNDKVAVEMRVVRRSEALRSVRVARALGSTQSTGDGAVGRRDSSALPSGDSAAAGRSAASAATKSTATKNGARRCAILFPAIKKPAEPKRIKKRFSLYFLSGAAR